MTLVSVIIPTLNRPELLKRAITSIYNQAFNDKIEIYIIDSSSNEETKSLCEKYTHVNLHNSKSNFYVYIISVCISMELNSSLQHETNPNPSPPIPFLLVH